MEQMKVKKYRYSIRRMWPGTLFLGLVALAGILMGGMILGGILILFFLIGWYFVANEQHFELTDTDIIYSAFGKPKKLKWTEIVRASIGCNPDFPWLFGFLSLSPEDNKRRIFVIYQFFADRQGFLQDILSHLLPTCQIGPHLIGLANEGAKYQWKTFLKTDGKSLLQGFIILSILIFVIWLFFKKNWLSI